MRHFLKIAGGVDTVPALNALALQPHLWNGNPLRNQFDGSPHAEADDIWLMFNDIGDDLALAIEDTQTRPYSAWFSLASLRALALDIMHRVGGTQLGRVIVTRLAPGKRITPHVDEGAPATFYTRYQVALQSLPGAVFRIGEEAVNFESGDVWMIDNRTEHEVTNNSADDRIVLIVDIRVPTC